MIKTILRKCPRCRREVEFKVLKSHNNKKIVCENCYLTIYIKKGEEVKKDLRAYFSYTFGKFEGGEF